MEPTKGAETVVKEVLGPLAQLGIKVPTKALAAVALAGIVVALLVVGWKWWKERRVRRAEQLAAGGDAEAVPELGASQLRQAWLRFSRTLPPSYRRSIHNFEHVIVVGEGGSGKSSLIDGCTDWQRQAKQFLKSQTNDPDLQVYLGSSVVAMELPSTLFQESGPNVRAALTRLWRPLYTVESPVVAVTVDAQRLRDARPEAITDVADRIRGIVNVLSDVGRRSVEVRVVATHLDQMEGWGAFAQLWRDNTIPLRIDVKTGEGSPPSRPQIQSWIERATGQISRGLTQQPSAVFRKTLSWLRQAPSLTEPLAVFVDALTAEEAVSRDIVFGGIYLSSLPHAQPNPLRNPKTSAARGDATQRHRIVAIAGAAALSVILLTIFGYQRALYEPAALAIADYNPALVGTDGEEQRRDAITEFAWKTTGFFSHHPDFFESARTKIRADASELIRTRLLIPNLRIVAATGRVHEGSFKVLWRKALYHIGLIHADKYDGMHILSPDRLEAWSFGTELPPDMIRDYVMLTDDAWLQPVTFDVDGATAVEVAAADQISYWTAFLGEIERTMGEDFVTPDDLNVLQARTQVVLNSLVRFTYDGVFRTILPNLDSAASLAPGHRGKVVQLEAVYRPRFADFVANNQGSAMFDQREQLSALLRTIIKSKLQVPHVPLISDLNSQLASLYDAPEDPSADRKIEIKVSGRQYSFDMKKWAEVLRDSAAVQSVREFSKARQNDQSIFFSDAADSELRPVSWNSTNDGTAVFLGSAKIKGRYSRAAYDTYVHDPLTALDERLAKVKLPKNEVATLTTFIEDELREYAIEYHAESARFAQSFSVGASSSEALRVALAQMTADMSPFIQYMDATANQANAPTDSPLLEPMRDLLEDMAPWKALRTGDASGEFGKYRAILAQLLTDLTNAGGSATASSGGGSAKGAPAPATDNPAKGRAKSNPQADATPAAGDDDTLEATISPAARVALLGLRAEKGSYGELVKDWLASIHLVSAYQPAFLSPLEQLETIGRTEITRVVRRVWEGEMEQEVAVLSTKFPFDRTAKEEATPEEIDAVLNPETGRFFQRFRDVIEPIAEVLPGRPFRELPALRGSIAVPENLFAIVNEVSAIASVLYDGSAKPIPITVRVEPVAFEHGPNVRASMTAMFIGVGDHTIYAFNQKPSVSPLQLDWTREQVAQVGVQLTDLTTRESSFGDPVTTPSSHWSVLRLLTMAETAAVGTGGKATTHSWVVHPQGGSDDNLLVRFNVQGDPFAPLRLSRVKMSRNRPVGTIKLRPPHAVGGPTPSDKSSSGASPSEKKGSTSASASPGGSEAPSPAAAPSSPSLALPKTLTLGGAQ